MAWKSGSSSMASNVASSSTMPLSLTNSLNKASLLFCFSSACCADELLLLLLLTEALLRPTGELGVAGGDVAGEEDGLDAWAGLGSIGAIWRRVRAGSRI